LHLLHPFVVILAVLVTLQGHAERGRARGGRSQAAAGATLRLLLLKPAAPAASVILSPEATAASSRFGGNFLVCMRERWAREGFLTILVDVPSDYQSARDGLGAFRLNAAHAVSAIARRR
jgi:hypothetical protein